MRSTASWTARSMSTVQASNDARPGVGVQDLRLEGQPVQGEGQPAVDRGRVPVLDLELVQRLGQLGDLAERDRLAPPEARQERRAGRRPAWPGVPEDDQRRGARA